MRPTLLAVLAAAAFLALLVVTHPLAVADVRPADTVRVGVYESRAIAIAFAPSRFNPVREKMAAYREAKAAGDDALAKELEEWGETHQRQLHFQGFGQVPVTDLLAHVEDRLAEVAAANDVVAIARACDFKTDDVELVDVTDALVALFDPSEKTLGFIAGIEDVDPLPLTDLADLDPRD